MRPYAWVAQQLVRHPRWIPPEKPPQPPPSAMQLLMQQQPAASGGRAFEDDCFLGPFMATPCKLDPSA